MILIDFCAVEPMHDELPPSIAIKLGVMIACNLNEYNDEEPQLGRGIEDPRGDSQDVEVEWMVGAYPNTETLETKKRRDLERKYHLVLYSTQ